MRFPAAIVSLVPPVLRSRLTTANEPSAPLERLACVLGVGVRELAAIRLGGRYHYRPFMVDKPDGRERRIFAPSPDLKRLQRLLLDGYLAQQAIHSSATGFHRKASTARHAQPHARSRLIATADLRDFFESTRGGRVRGWFRAQGWSGDALGVLMRLCVFRDGLPQGAPTSPCLSNLVNFRLDERLEGLAERSGGVYTRYGDDLAFSWNEDVLPGGFLGAVEDALARSGYEIQPAKGWDVRPASARPRVTGIILAGDGRLRLPLRVRVRAIGLRLQALWTQNPADLARSRGYDGYLKMIDRPPVVLKKRRARRR